MTTEQKIDEDYSTRCVKRAIKECAQRKDHCLGVMAEPGMLQAFGALLLERDKSDQNDREIEGNNI